MSATTHDIVQRKPSNFSTARKNGGSAAATGADFSAVTTVRGALDLCGEAWKAEHVVTTNSIGKASSVLAT